MRLYYYTVHEKGIKRELKLEVFPTTHSDYRNDISPLFIVNSLNNEVNAIELKSHSLPIFRNFIFSKCIMKIQFHTGKGNRLAQCIFKFRECLKRSLK
jgi:hypothetical protein